MAAPVVSTNNEDIELKVTGVKTTVVENVELTLFPQRYPVERSYTGRFEGRQKCQERNTARSRSYASSGKSRLPSPVARASVRKSVGERLQRELQRKAQGRTAGSGDLLYIAGGADTDRRVQTDLQRHQTTQLAGLQTAGAAGSPVSGPCPSACRTNITSGTSIGGRSV